MTTRHPHNFGLDVATIVAGEMSEIVGVAGGMQTGLELARGGVVG